MVDLKQGVSLTRRRKHPGGHAGRGSGFNDGHKAIEDFDDSRQEKIKLLRKKGSKDLLFLSDINKVNSDFADTDNELL